MMQKEIGQQLLDNQSGDDEAIAFACNGCIESVIQLLSYAPQLNSAHGENESIEPIAN